LSLGLLAGCDDARSTFGGAEAKAHHLVKTQFHLTHVRFGHESRGYSPDVDCGLVTADSPHGRIDNVEFIANGDAYSAVINSQALSFVPKPPAVPNQPPAIDDAMADCVFPQIWKAMCRQPLSAQLVEQQKRCPP
jgi:hypothetical protein